MESSEVMSDAKSDSENSACIIFPGQEFDSLEHATSHLKRYATINKFTIAKSSVKIKDGVNRDRFICSRGGTCKSSAGGNTKKGKRRSSSLKCGCTFFVSLRSNDQGTRVISCCLEHKFPCVPSEEQLKMTRKQHTREIRKREKQCEGFSFKNCTDFSDKVVLITGAGSGIGRALAVDFSYLGATVVCVDINLELVDDLVNQICADTRSKATALHVDVSKEDQIKQMIDNIVAMHGHLDIAINNAGIEGVRAPIWEMPSSNFDSVFETNAKGVFLCMQQEIKQMRKQIEEAYLTGNYDQEDEYKSPKAKKMKGESSSRELTSNANIDLFDYSIVNISSGAGLCGMPEFAAYSASKHAIIGLTKSAAVECAPVGIRINAVCPSTTYTPMVQRFEDQWPEWQRAQNLSFPPGRIGRVNDVVNSVLWLCSSSCRFIIGHTLNIDGGAGV